MFVVVVVIVLCWYYTISRTSCVAMLLLLFSWSIGCLFVIIFTLSLASWEAWWWWPPSWTTLARARWSWGSLLCLGLLLQLPGQCHDFTFGITISVSWPNIENTRSSGLTVPDSGSARSSLRNSGTRWENAYYIFPHCHLQCWNCLQPTWQSSSTWQWWLSPTWQW